MGQLDGKIAIVTGGGTGIGKGIAKAFVDEGCSVVIAARNANRLNEAAEELSSWRRDDCCYPNRCNKRRSNDQPVRQNDGSIRQTRHSGQQFRRV